jgi:transcription antitermination factor NusG
MSAYVIEQGEANPTVAILAAGLDEPHWYAVYTCVRHEKKVAEQLAAKAVNTYVPLYETTRRWGHRRATVTLPLFPGYIFTRIALRERLKVLTVAGVVRFVSVNGQAVPLCDVEIEGIQRGLDAHLRTEPHPYLTRGRRVRVTRGPMSGCEGILVRHKGQMRVVIQLDAIMRAMAVEVDIGDVELAPRSQRDLS